MKVLFDRFKIQALEFLCVVKLGTHWIALRGILMEHLQVELIGPPIRVRQVTRRRISLSDVALIAPYYRALTNAFWFCSWFRRGVLLRLRFAVLRNYRRCDADHCKAR
jgi:hypothetical protein